MKSIKSSDIALLVLRVVAGLILVYAGALKLVDVHKTAEAFKGMGFPLPLMILAIAGELLGGLGMVFGVLSRIAAFGGACTMAVATYKMATVPGIWADIVAGKPNGLSTVAFPLVILACCLAVLLQGGGQFCLDRLVMKRRGSK